MSARGGSAWARKHNRDGVSAAAFGATLSTADRGAYSVVFDASRGTVKRTPRFVVTYNGKTVPGAEHASAADGWVAAHQLSKTCATDIRCFSVVPQ